MGFRISLDGDERIIGKLNDLLSIPQNPKKLLKQSGDLVLESVNRTFTSEGRELGQAWKRLSPNTIRARVRAGYGAGPILQRTGRLKNSFVQFVTNSYTRITSNNPYYKYHQKGGSIIPQRKMLGLTNRIKEDIVRVFADEYRKILNK